MTIDISAQTTFMYGGARVNIYHANAGEGSAYHKHPYNHATMCVHGSCKVKQGTTEVIINKDSKPVNLLAGIEHDIEAIEDGTIYVNVFAENKY